MTVPGRLVPELNYALTMQRLEVALLPMGLAYVAGCGDVRRRLDELHHEL